MRLRTGLDRLLTEPNALAGRSYGVLAHGASVTDDLRPIHLALAASGAPAPAALFGPEHGFYGVEQDMVASADEVDPWTGVAIVSLYGESEASLRPSAEAFDGLDLLVIDLQDVGSRYYTYAATAVWAAEVAVAAGLEVWLLDRPNPLGGEVVEGNARRAGFDSFVGAFETPVRHGLTLAELVLLEAHRAGWVEQSADQVRIWEMEGWRRELTWRDLSRRWIAPSPNMPTFDTAVVYPGGCLVEATTISEGRGTTRPFELVGAPGISPTRLVERLEAAAIPGVSFLPTYFKPQFQKHAGEACGGVQCVVTDARVFPAYRCGIELIVALYGEVGTDGFWRPDPYEFVTDRPAIDLLSGADRLRRALAGKGSVESWCASWAGEEAAFRSEVAPLLLYPPSSGSAGESG